MRRNARKKGADIYDVPDGNSLFILAPLKGRSEPVLSFLDSGCSDAVFQHGVPGDQLQGICVNEGPITCTGVGNIQLQARQEWIVKFKRKDGNYQLVQGLTLDTVCAPMPIVNTVPAVQELKLSDSSNDALQNCCVPAVIGGEVSVILGIRYNNIGPKLIHTLVSGLSIYAINLETHDPTHNAAIGGPHHSLTAMLHQNGGISKVSQTLQLLYTKLDNFKRFGPPRIPHIPLSKAEMEYATDLFHEEFEISDKCEIFYDEFEYDTLWVGNSSTSRNN